MAQKARLTYVNGRGNAERIRFVLAAANIEYEENNFATKKDRIDFLAQQLPVGGVVPCLEIDGLTLAQSWSIIRYIARHHHLEPEEVSQQVKADMISECVRDFESAANLGGYGWSDKEEHQQKMRDAVAKWFPRFEDMVVGPCVLGPRAFYCDFVLLNSLLYIQDVLGAAALSHYPKLSALTSHLVEMPSIKTFLTSSKRKGLVDEAYKTLVREVFF